jgi:ribosomal protein L3 glutamine methyltransferase
VSVARQRPANDPPTAVRAPSAAEVAGFDAAAAEAARELVTLRDFVRFAATRIAASGAFLGHGTDDPVDEAAALVLHTLCLDHTLPSELWSARLTAGERRVLLERLRRRVVERVPTPYLTGRARFAGLDFYVDERVLIPRSPIAECIEAGFEPWVEHDTVHRVLDLGTGSGCIAIACALAFPQAHVDAVDVSSAALEVARRNVSSYGLDGRVRLIESDLFDGVEGRYDLIVSNPPYVDAEALDRMPGEFCHEPALALGAGADGLNVVRRILDAAPRYLEPSGLLVVEVGASRPALERAFPDLAFVWLELARGGEGVFALGADQLGR